MVHRVQVLGGKNAEESKRFIFNRCPLFGDKEAYCHSFMDYNYTTLYDALNNDLSSEKLCTGLNVCNQSPDNSKVIHVNQCDLCKSTTSTVIKYLEHVDESTIQKVADRVCSSDDTHLCQPLFKEYALGLTDAMPVLSPQQLCQEMSFCEPEPEHK